MSKAVLVMDMPNSCKECFLFGDHYSDILGDHYIDYLEFYTNRCRELEEQLSDKNNI